MAVLAPDQPELLALAALASVPASKMAAAFNDPEQFFDHMSLEELGRLTAAIERLNLVSQQMMKATQVWALAAKAALEETEAAD